MHLKSGAHVLVLATTAHAERAEPCRAATGEDRQFVVAVGQELVAVVGRVAVKGDRCRWQHGGVGVNLAEGHILHRGGLGLDVSERARHPAAGNPLCRSLLLASSPSETAPAAPRPEQRGKNTRRQSEHHSRARLLCVRAGRMAAFPNSDGSVLEHEAQAQKYVVRRDLTLRVLTR